jgi:YbgC/YbaW family acyl-CoA thioester hydrolase
MSVKLTVYPDECDAFGHLNQSAYLALFERARWELLSRGPGMNVFVDAGVWPAVRRATVDYHAGAWPGDVLEFTTELVSRGRTSFTLRQRAVRERDQRLSATLETVFVCIDANERPAPIPEAVLGALAAEPQRRVLPNGVTLTYDEAGQGGTPVLLVHGYPFDRTMWREQLLGLSGRRVIAVDLRGFGATAAPEPAERIEDYADDLAALLEALGIPRVVLAGLSMGGYVALAFAERHRQRLAGLALLDTKATPDDAKGRAGRDAAIDTIAREGTAGPNAGMLEKLFATDTPAQVREGVAAMMRGAKAEAMIAALAAMRDRPSRTELLRELDLPVLVLVGSEDRLTPPSDSEAMMAALPKGELVVVEGAGHLPPLERPATVNEALGAWLDQVV